MSSAELWKLAATVISSIGFVAFLFCAIAFILQEPASIFRPLPLCMVSGGFLAVALWSNK